MTYNNDKTTNTLLILDIIASFVFYCHRRCRKTPPAFTTQTMWLCVVHYISTLTFIIFADQYSLRLKGAMLGV